jgi:membrane protease YdiL (CAAX protease family)
MDMDVEQESNLLTGKYEFWRYLLVTVVIVGVTLISQLILIFIGSIFEGNLDVMQYSSITLLWVSMLPFAFLLLFLVLGIRFVHHQKVKSIFTQKSTFNTRLVLVSFVLWFALSGISDVVLALLQPGNYTLTFNIGKFIPYMLIAVILVLFQISAEEVLFRHYFLHGFSRLFRFHWIAIIAQAIIFGLLHGANPEVTAYGLLTTMPFYIGMGLLLGWFSIRSRGLEIALGLHFANNIYATSMVTFKESAIPSPAIFTINNYQPEIGLIVFVVITIIFSLIMIPEIKQNIKE